MRTVKDFYVVGITMDGSLGFDPVAIVGGDYEAATLILNKRAEKELPEYYHYAVRKIPFVSMNYDLGEVNI